MKEKSRRDGKTSPLRREGRLCAAFAPGAEAGKFVAPRYSYRLLANFGTPSNLNAAFRHVTMPSVDHRRQIRDIAHSRGSKIAAAVLRGVAYADMPPQTCRTSNAIDAAPAAFKG
jgi:hypothetical protein